MEDKNFRGDKNWLEEYLPLKWGGLQVFLWGLVYLLITSLSINAMWLDYNDRFLEEDPVTIVLNILSMLLWGFVTITTAVNLLRSAGEEHLTLFPWGYLSKYLRNNVIGVKLNFLSKNNGMISVDDGRDTFVIRRDQLQTIGAYGEREKETISFSIRCAGWFWRRQMMGGTGEGKLLDFSDAISERKSRALYWFRYSLSRTLFEFSDFCEAMDFWHSPMSDSPKRAIKKAAELEILTKEVENLKASLRAKDMHIAEFGRRLLQIYQEIAISLAESSRLKTNKESSKLIRKLLSMGLNTDELWHEFTHKPDVPDPETNRHLEEVEKICKHYLADLDKAKEPKASAEDPPSATTP